MRLLFFLKPPLAARWPRSTAVILVSLVSIVLLALLWLARAPLAARFAERALASRGLGAADVEIFNLSPSHATLALRGSALGEIARMELDYRLSLAAGVQVERVRISGARLQLAWRDGQWWPLPGSSSSGDAPLPALALQLDDVRVSLRVGAELLHVRVDGSASNTPALMAQLRFALGARHGQIEGTLNVQPEVDGSINAQLGLAEGHLTIGSYSVESLRGELAARSGPHGLEHLAGGFSATEVRSKDQRWGAVTLAISRPAADAVQVALRANALQSDLRLDGVSAGAPRALTLDAKLDARMLAALLPGVDSAAGHVNLHVRTQLPEPRNALDEWLQRAQLQASLALKAEHIHLHDGAHLTGVSAEVNCATATGTLTCTSAEGLKAQTMMPVAAGGAADRAPTVSTSLALNARDGAPLLTLSNDKAATKLALAAELTSRNATLALRAPLTARVTLATPSVTAPLRSGNFDIEGGIDAERPLGEAWLAPAFQLKGDFRADLNTRALTALTITDGEIKLARQAWSATNLRARYAAGAAPGLTVSIGQLRNTQTPARVAPLTANLEARMTGGQTLFEAILRDFEGQFEARVKGQHQHTDGAGEAQLTLKPIKIANADQVRALLPAAAADLRDARGELSASGAVQWNKSGQHSQLSFGLHELAFSTATLKVEQLNAALALDNLAPLHSAAGQTLSARLELPTLKQVPVTLRFQVADRHVRLEYARADMFDGAFEVHDGDIDISSGATRMDVEVVNVDLASAFTVLNLEQLKGSGRLAGRLPLRFENRHIAVVNGELAANGPGVVQLGANAVTDQLKTHGADVELAFRALSDFHYRSLAISADKPLLGAGKALFHLEGESPAVMSGQPFVFNISLETDFDYLAALLLQLSGITSSALGWGAGELLKP